MNFMWIESLSAVGMFAGMIFSAEVGRRIRLARLTEDSESAPRGAGLAEGAVFGLIGLVIAFTFSGAASRFQDRRALITEEANNIGTAYLRIDLLPDETQPEMRELFRRYLDLRLTTHLRTEDDAATEAQLAETNVLQGAIWETAVTATMRPEAPSPEAMLLLPALNAMFDIRTTRVMTMQNHPPIVVFQLLGVLCLVGAFLVGYGISSDKERSWLHIVVFAAVLSLAFYTILDLEYPRLGFIRINTADEVLIDLRESMD